MQTCSTWYLALDYFLAERCGSLTEHLSTPQTNSSYASQIHCYYIQYLSNQFVYWTGYYSLLKNKNPHRLTVVIISGSRQQTLKRKPNHITTLSTPQMYIMHMLSTCTPAVFNLYPWFDYISWKHGCPETAASYPTSQRQSPRTYTLQANMNRNNKHKGMLKMMRWTSQKWKSSYHS